jgi:hypothetical protein
LSIFYAMRSTFHQGYFFSIYISSTYLFHYCFLRPVWINSLIKFL